MDVFTHLGHIALRVKDLDASIAFYGKLGFRELTRLKNDKGETWIVYLRINDQTILELFPKGTGAWAPTGTGVGIFHISLTVEDIDKTEAYLAKLGIPLSRPRSPGRGIDGNRGMWIADPDGTPIEIMEMAPNCIQYQALARLKAEPA